MKLEILLPRKLTCVHLHRISIDSVLFSSGKMLKMESNFDVEQVLKMENNFDAEQALKMESNFDVEQVPKMGSNFDTASERECIGRLR